MKIQTVSNAVVKEIATMVPGRPDRTGSLGPGRRIDMRADVANARAPDYVRACVSPVGERRLRCPDR